MRILNDKEIEDVLGCWCGQMHEYKAVAKAQHQQDLKDFVEWGEELCTEHYHPSSMHPAAFGRGNCLECWLSLKQLVGL